MICLPRRMRRGAWFFRAPRRRRRPGSISSSAYSDPMPSAYRDIFADWSPPIVLTGALILCGVIYVRGWFAIRKTRPVQFPWWRPGVFLLGLAVIWVAIASPLDGFADELLSAHMVEHLLLMSFAPPLLLLGYPVVPMLRGLPRVLRIYVFGPLIRSKMLRN